MATSITDILYFWSEHSPSSLSLKRDISNLEYPVKQICVDNKETRAILKNNRKIKISNVPALCLVLSNKNIIPFEGIDIIVDWIKKSGIPIGNRAQEIEFEPVAKKKKKKVSFAEKSSDKKKKKSSKKSGRIPEEFGEPIQSVSSNSDIEFIDNNEQVFSGKPSNPYQKPDKKKDLMNNIFSMAQQMAAQSKETYGYDEEELPKYH